MEEARYADDKRTLANLICSVWLTPEPLWENISGGPGGVMPFSSAGLGWLAGSPGFPGSWKSEGVGCSDGVVFSSAMSSLTTTYQTLPLLKVSPTRPAFASVAGLANPESFYSIFRFRFPQTASAAEGPTSGTPWSG